MHFLIQTKSGSRAWNRLSTVSKLNQVISQRVLILKLNESYIFEWTVKLKEELSCISFLINIRYFFV